MGRGTGGQVCVRDARGYGGTLCEGNTAEAAENTCIRRAGGTLMAGETRGKEAHLWQGTQLEKVSGWQRGQKAHLRQRSRSYILGSGVRVQSSRKAR